MVTDVSRLIMVITLKCIEITNHYDMDQDLTFCGGPIKSLKHTSKYKLIEKEIRLVATRSKGRKT